jgi:ferredoxin-like protein FixX
MDRKKLIGKIKVKGKLKATLEDILKKHLKEEVTTTDASVEYGYDMTGPNKDLVKFCICPVCKTYVDKDENLACSMHECPECGSAMVNKIDARVDTE